MSPNRPNLLKTALAAAAVVLAAAQMIRPARTNPAVNPSRTLEARVGVEPAAAAVLDRACRDCHSNETAWPWYSNIAPVSWFVIDHVNHGRRHLNFSDWDRLNRAEAGHMLDQICKELRAGMMPLSSYALVHRAARVTPQETEAVCAWTAVARRDDARSAAP
jgi:hypothetical protein